MSKRYVSFVLGTGRYCVPVDEVIQILRPDGILPVPKAPPFVAGAITLRGDVIPVVNLTSRLSRDADSGTSASRARIIIIRAGSRMCGLSVDEVREIVDIDETKIQEDPTGALGTHADFILGVAQQGQSLLAILDLPRVLSAGRNLQGASPV
ncbi:MAG TPA: chemotaxis protein CheW [Spirochaetia bacterium]|nr:chemotaxis protein CheW [Spirochaetia bacterium]